MSKIYEALENAERNSTRPAMQRIALPVTTALPKAMEEKLLSLSKRLEGLVDNAQGARVLEFVGVQSGEDTSKLAFEFAKLVALRQQCKVLLLAAGPYPYLQRLFSGVTVDSWEPVLRGEKTLDDVLYPLDNNSLSLGRLSMSDLSLGALLAAPEINQLMQEVRSRYDLVIIDAPPFAETSNALLLSSIADGVVLIVEAGKTRWQAIRHDINRITAHGAEVLGVILNRRRYYIPEFIYRRL